MEGQDNNYRVSPEGYYGTFGGAYVPEILHRCVEELRESYLRVIESEAFMQEFSTLLRDYAGRPSPLYHAARMSERYGCRLYLKREDLNHTGSHKINNALGQVLLARHLGRRRVIAETGAGQHGVAVATVCALMGMECMIYMGRTDTERQRANVEKIRMLGGEVTPVESGNMTLKDATNEAIREWCRHPSDTYYVIGSTVGPHPYPDLVARLQSVIGREIPGAPHETLLVLDAGTGQNAISQAELFTQAAPVSGVVLTKLDGTAKGGVTIGIKAQLSIPIKWIGVGEGMDDLRPFRAEDFVRALFVKRTDETQE